MSDLPKAIWFNPMENSRKIRFDEVSELWQKYATEYVPIDKLKELTAENERLRKDNKALESRKNSLFAQRNKLIATNVQLRDHLVELSGNKESEASDGE